MTPAYEVAYKERWREQTELGQVKYDRLGHCEPPGYPRILLEPYTHEFINLPDVAYQINDFGPSIRRTYIGKEHSNVYGTHSWYGDTIGFWDGNKLVSNTKCVLPADFTRWSPMTSNLFEGTEIWELKTYPGGVERLEVQVTFYDKHLLQKPVSVVYAYRRATDMVDNGHRVQHWECDQTNNAFLDDQGVTQLPSARRGRVQRRPRDDVVPRSAGPNPRSDLQHDVRQRVRESTMKSIVKLLSAGTAAALLTMTVAEAHHSFAMFDRDQEIVKTGTVVRWAFNNPHSWLYLNVKNEDGTDTLWSFEGSAPPSLVQRGITGATFEPGDTVTFMYCPLRDGRPGGAIGWAQTEDGKYINPADGGCAGNEQSVERWKGWLAKGYTSKAEAEKAQ